MEAVTTQQSNMDQPSGREGECITGENEQAVNDRAV